MLYVPPHMNKKLTWIFKKKATKTLSEYVVKKHDILNVFVV